MIKVVLQTRYIIVANSGAARAYVSGESSPFAMTSSYSQLRQVLRRLAKTPTFGIVTVLTLAVAIGANTAIFSVVNGVLIKPLPFPEPDRLVSIWHTAPGVNLAEVNACPATYFTYREESHAFEDSGVWRTEDVTITGVAEPERVVALVVTDSVLPVLGSSQPWGGGLPEKTTRPAHRKPPC